VILTVGEKMTKMTLSSGGSVENCAGKEQKKTRQPTVKVSHKNRTPKASINYPSQQTKINDFNMTAQPIEALVSLQCLEHMDILGR
jgi:hypothetical protein